MTRCIALILALAAFAQDARGDAAPFPRVGNGEVRLFFENLNQFGDFDFYVRHRPQFGPHARTTRLTKLQNGAAFKLDQFRHRPSDVFLVAVPKGQSIVLPENDVNQNELQQQPLPGTIQTDTLNGDPSGGPLPAAYFYHELTYRIRLVDGVLHAECIDASRPGLQLGLMVFGGFASAVVLLLVGGVFMALKIRSRRNEPVSI